MSDALLRDDPPPAPLGRRRGEVLRCLQAAEEPVSVAQVAERTALHVNTARFHLDLLVEQGHAERVAEQRRTPGRPRMLYAARQHTTGRSSYRLLAQMLAGMVSSLDVRGTEADEAGRAWGRRLVEHDATVAPPQADAGAAVERLNALLDAIGFDPELSGTGDDVEVLIHHCPFGEVAVEHRDVVCALHRGLMHGALEALDAPVEVQSLQPFAEPGLCVARLRSARATATGPGHE